jgi:hypothetical protein
LGNNADVDQGWYVDDIDIVSGPLVFNTFEDWENGLGDWHVDQGTWEIGGGPGNAHSGEKTAATVVGGTYDENVSSRLISPSFTVPDADEQPRLRFWHRYSFSNRDSAQVQIKVDAGQWQALSPSYTGSSSNVWSRATVDLTPFAGNTVQLALHFASLQDGNGADVDKGWYVDDLAILTGTPAFDLPESWENGLGDWHVDQGTWEVGGGPGNAHSGANTAATALGAEYAENVASRLISPTFRLPDVGPTPHLVFWHRFSFSARDSAWVQVRTNAEDWQNLSPPYSGTSNNTWENVAIDLSAYAEETEVQLAFYFTSLQDGDKADVSSGWYVDDIDIVQMEVDDTPPDSVDAETPAIVLSATVLNFGAVETNASAARELTLSNAGGAVLNIDLQTNADTYRVTPASAQLDPGTSVDATLTFAPTAEGNFEAQLLVTSNDPATPELTVLLLGETPIQEPLEPPAAPTLIAPVDGAVDQAVQLALTWNATENAATYSVQLDTDAAFSNPVIEHTDLSATTLEIDDLQQGTVYFWRVQADSEAGSSPWSAIRNFSTLSPPGEPPAAPTDLAVADAQLWNRERAFTLIWTDPPTETAIARAHYKIGQPPTASSDESGNVSGSSPITVVVDTEGEHLLYLWLEDADGQTDFNQWSSTTLRYDATAPAAPALTSPAADTWLNTAAVTFSWQTTTDALSGLAGYLLFVDGLQIDSTAQTSLTHLLTPVPHEWSVVAVDRAGNHSAATTRTLRLDDSAPQNPSRISAWADASRANALVDAAWHTTSTPHFEWSGATDQDAGIAHYAVRFTADAADTVALDAVQSETAYTVAASLSDAQTYYLRLRTADRAGNWSAATTLFTYHYDISAPTLESAPVSTHGYNSALSLSTTATDAGAIESVSLFYRAGGEERFNTLAMPQSDASYETSVAATAVTRRGLEYYFQATDQAGNSATLPSAGAQSPLSLQVTFTSFAAPTAHAADLWRLVSLPVLADDGNPLRRLAALGTYDPLQWRFFRFVGNTCRELTQDNIGDFTPGRAFWLHARTPSFTLNSGAGRTVPLTTPFEIVLEPGWNTLASPFAFPVRWSDIAAANGDPVGVTGPYAYDGITWSTPRSTDQLEPWQGYAVKNANTDPVTLLVPARAADQRGKATTQNATWVLQIGATGDHNSDLANFIGFRADAQLAWDRWDLPEPPPPPGPHLRLYTPHPDWPLYPDAYTADFRPPAPTAQWDFVIESSTATQAQLFFNAMGDLPPHRSAHLLDLDRHIAMPLSQVELYPLALNAKEKRHFRLIVGAPDQVEKLSTTFQTLPSTYALEQNHPNPFNAETLISYQLAERGAVRLTIYDLLGRPLTVLVDQFQDGGLHLARWDGFDAAGRSVASGVYFYALETPTGQLTRKMILLR